MRWRAGEVAGTIRSRQAVGAEPLGLRAGVSGRKPASSRVAVSSRETAS